jgi:FkbM family methyltransferase
VGLRRTISDWHWRRYLASEGLADVAQHSRSQLQQDLWALAELHRKRHGFFVEVGAGDGLANSNTYLLEQQFGWRGILVEPNPGMQDRLRRNRPGSVIATEAIYSRRGRMTFLCVEGAAFELSTLSAHANDDRNAPLRSEHRTVEVDTITLLDLLQRHDAPRQIDYLSLDTEGSEAEILGAFDFSAYDVALISVEHNHTEKEPEIDQFMTAAGYRRVFRRQSKFDAWYRRELAGRGATPC